MKKFFHQLLSISTLFTITFIIAGCLFLPLKIHAKTDAKTDKKDKLTWYVSEWAPYHITRGKLKRQGINDKLIKYIHKFLPDYEVEWQNMTPTLLNQSFANGDNICQLDLFKTPEREKIAYFTQFPAIIDAPLRLFIKSSDAKQMDLKPPIDLQNLLSVQRYRGAFVAERSYGPQMDDIIDANIGRQIKKKESTKRVIKDFFKGKSDFVVEYSAVMSYFKSVMKYRRDILSIPIQGTKPYVLGYTACSKTLWGKTVVEKINKILKDQRHSAQYKQIIEQWHDQRTKNVIMDNYFYF